MPLHILLSSLTDKGRKTVGSGPDGIKKANREIEGMGADDRPVHEEARDMAAPR